ncbi:helix-turn-helix domain-containing protein [Clostridium manihotivorum]|uniref:DNA-binding protein n=1 Tax=Clostridium manihotivorum TaxID=2320868 RepID=A0A3R5TCU4_9CLOT|nr:helix-turn-helix domain-containing protein [Clostridium manihotivorum]QAA30363.1 DNA-binding protein [Clostridium manihotivorum]
MNYNDLNIKKTMSVKEFSTEYGIGLNKAYELINSTNFPVIRCGKKYVIIRSKVDDWMFNQAGKCF